MDFEIRLALNFIIVTPLKVTAELVDVVRQFLTQSRTDEEAKLFLHQWRDWACYTGGADKVYIDQINKAIGEQRSFPPPSQTYDDWLDSFSLEN